jgi:glucose-1-phosphate thymidylyltransferase
MKCLILAGGFATRLYPLTLNRAKALLLYQGKPIISHIIDKIPHSVDILVTTNKKFESDFLNWQTTLDRHVDLCIEDSLSDDQKKGAVGAIDFWIKDKNINEDLMVIAADNYFEFDLADMINKFNGNCPLIAVYDVGDKEKACEIGIACQVGLVILENDKIIRLDEKPQQPTSSIVSSGIYVIPSRLFPLLASYSQKKRDNLGSFISFMLNQGEEVKAYVFNQIWMDLGEEIKRGRISIQ